MLRQIVHEIFDDLSMKVEPLLQVKSRNEREQLITFYIIFMNTGTFSPCW